MRVTITAHEAETHVGIYDASGEQEGGAYSATPDGLLHLAIIRYLSDEDVSGGGYGDACHNYLVNLDRGTITKV